MKKKFFLILLSASVFLVYGFDTNIDIIYKNVREVYSEDSRELTYDEGEEIEITFTAPSITGRKAFMKLSLLKGADSKLLMEDDNLIYFNDILTKEYDDCYLVCDIKTENNEEKQLKVHFKRSATESEENSKFSGNLFKIVLISLGAFIVISISLMITIAIYNKFKRKHGANRPRYPIYTEIIPMKKFSENSQEENEANLVVQSDHDTVPNEYIDTPHKPLNGVAKT